MENNEPEEVTYNYDGKELKFMSDAFSHPAELVTRHVHVRANYTSEPFLVGELISVRVQKSDAEEFDAGCPHGPLVVASCVHGIAVNVPKGYALPVGSGCRQLYGDDLPVFDKDKLAERSLRLVIPNKYRYY